MYKGEQFVVYLICKCLFLLYLIQMLQTPEVIFVCVSLLYFETYVLYGVFCHTAPV